MCSLILQQVDMDLFQQTFQISKSMSRSTQSSLRPLRISTSHTTYSISPSKSQGSAYSRNKKEAPPLESYHKECGYRKGE